MATQARLSSQAPAPALSPFDLNLRHLRGLLAVCEERTVSAAAQTLNLSQPALTQGIVKLEQQLGEVLFERRPDGMRPTAAGHIVAQRAQAALDHLGTAGRLVAGPGFQPERRVTMTQLRAFLALVQAGSFAAASARMNLSETAVNRAVRDLEAALEKPLVERRGRGVHVNFGGRRFARACRLAGIELQAAFSELGIDPRSSTITVGTTPLARTFLVPEAMAAMASGPRAAGFQVLEGSWGELVETLRDGVIDLVIGELPPNESPDLLKVPLYEESFVIVAGQQHPLVGSERPTLETLASYPWIVGPEDSPLRAEWERLFAGRPRPEAPIECGSIMIIGRLLTSTSMLTLATPDQVALQIRSGLLARVGAPLAESRHTIGVTMRHNWRPTASQRIFLEHLELAASEMGQQGINRPSMASRWN